MGILSRISKVLESNLNSIVERAEDPAKMLEQAIEDMKRGRQEARDAIIEAKTQKRLLQKKRDKALVDAEGYEARAMQALQNGDEDRARKALELKIAAEQRAAAETSAIEEQTNQITQLEGAERELERRLSEMPARRAALIARQAAAQAKGAKMGATTKAKNSVANALDAFDRMEERIIRAEVEAEVISEGDPALLEAGPPINVEAERALQALKAKMKALPSGAEAEPEPPEAPDPAAASAVDDHLAELKQKLGQ